MPGNGVLNIVGDEGQGTGGGGAGMDEADIVRVEGTGVGAGTVVLSHLGVKIPQPPNVLFTGVSFLNVVTHDEGDTLDITPYADNTPAGWGIAVFYDEGLPTQADPGVPDLLVYRTSLNGGPVSEDIVVQPSAPEAGELRSTNTADGSLVVAISYVANLDIMVVDDDGFASDTDTLTLRGANPDPVNPDLSGREEVAAIFTNAGDVASPMVTVSDVLSGMMLYRLRRTADLLGGAETFNTINFDLLGGQDSISLVGRADSSLMVNVDDAEEINFDTTTGLDTYVFVPGPDVQSGEVRVRHGRG
jgi:hypothetical protein